MYLPKVWERERESVRKKGISILFYKVWSQEILSKLIALRQPLIELKMLQIQNFEKRLKGIVID